MINDITFVDKKNKNADNRVDTGNISGVTPLDDNCSPFEDPF